MGMRRCAAGSTLECCCIWCLSVAVSNLCVHIHVYPTFYNYFLAYKKDYKGLQINNFLEQHLQNLTGRDVEL